MELSCIFDSDVRGSKSQVFTARIKLLFSGGFCFIWRVLLRFASHTAVVALQQGGDIHWRACFICFFRSLLWRRKPSYLVYSKTEV